MKKNDLYASVAYDYYYLDGQLVGQKWGNKKLAFIYDESGNPYQLAYDDGTTTNYYYYITNLQGDVVRIRACPDDTRVYRNRIYIATDSTHFNQQILSNP